MRIGITYDLRSAYLAAGYSEEETAEFDRDDTVDAIEAALRQLGHETVRIGCARELIEHLAAGQRWDLVFNICEGLSGPGRESQVPAILEVYGIPVTFADTAVMALSLNKAWAKTVVADAGVATPQHAVIARAADVATVALEPPLFVKPIGEGTGKGTSAASVVMSAAELERQSLALLERYRQPVLVETYLPGREFTVGLLGTGPNARVLGTLEIELLATAEANVYSYLNKEECESRVLYRLVDGRADPVVARAEAAALGAWRALGARDGGRIDLRADSAGEPNFIEANPLAGLHPAHSDLPMLATAVGMPYAELIRAIVDSALERLAMDATEMNRCA
jgi:D-alanine-D-alanine ligase